MAIEFNGNNWITISNFNIPTKTTISLWIYLKSYNSSQRLFGTCNNWEGRLASRKLYNDLYQGSSVAGSTTLNLYTWYFVVFTGDSTNGDVFTYLNLNQEAFYSYNTNMTYDTNLGIGNRYDSSERFIGLMDDFRVYDRVLSGAELETIYNAEGCDNIVYGLKNRYLFNENAPGNSLTTLIDVGPEGKNGVGSNNPTYQEGILTF